MKRYRKYIAYAFAPALLAVMSLAVSCNDDVVVTADDFAKYEAAKHSYGYIKNAVAPVERLVDLYQADVERKVEVGLTKTMKHSVGLNVTIDESVLTAYNRANNTKFEMLPASLVTLGQGSKTVIAPGYTTANPISVKIAPSADLVQGTTYVIPLRISSDDADVVLTDKQDNYLFYVTAKGDRINPEKSRGYKVLSCMETGDADPRLLCELFLKNEGKPLFDMLALFSANLNYNAAEGKVYIHMNNSITPILNNRDRYLKPLQDMGIKVLLGLMGNWDPAGVSHLPEATAREFIETQVKPCIEAYGLDGVFWDDEYTSPNPSIPGFSSSSKANASRLIFEFKMAMPDKINFVYAYSTLYGLNTVDGVQAGEYVDYWTSDYGASVAPSYFAGATSKQGMPRPYEMTGRATGSPSTVVSGNWGGIMVFAMGEHRSNWTSFQLPGLRNIASTMFGDELYYTGATYPMEW